MSQPPSVADLLDRADAARSAGRGDTAARLYDEAIARCRTDGDLAGWTRAALGAASAYVFGAQPGKLPAQLYDVLVRTTDDADRARLAAALARCWAYAGHAARAAEFADEAVQRAGRTGQPQLLADCLDAALAAHWGPDELDSRVTLAGRLDDAAAHVLDPGTRLQAHLWGLQVACEALHVQAMYRHMRALELLGEESPRARFFAASRRLMLDLLRGRTDTAPQLIAMAADAGRQADLPDAWMVVESMKGYSALQSGDTGACAAVAAACEAFGLAEGATAVCAEAAYLWTGAGQPDRAAALLDTFHGDVLHQLPRDVNWLLTVQCVLEAALATGHRDLVATASRLLTPYAGRAVFNAGAVMFHGLTDDTLARATAVLADAAADAEAAAAGDRLRERAVATYNRLGASWWRDRLANSPTTPPPGTGPDPAAAPIRLHPTAGDLWLIGPAERAVPTRPLRGFTYLRHLLRRPGQPVPALDLVTAGQDTIVQPDLGPTLDRRAVTAYRHRLTSLADDIAEAERWSDIGRLELLHAERDALVHELSAATGLGGRARTTGSHQERARIAATKAITAAIDRITAIDEPAGRHLKASIHTGHHCAYLPDHAAPRWLLD